MIDVASDDPAQRSVPHLIVLPPDEFDRLAAWDDEPAADPTDAAVAALRDATSAVTVLDERRPPEVAACPRCGGEWFTLRARHNDPPGAEHGAVALRADGTVRSYTGIPECLECGTMLTDPTKEGPR